MTRSRTPIQYLQPLYILHYRQCTPTWQQRSTTKPTNKKPARHTEEYYENKPSPQSSPTTHLDLAITLDYEARKQQVSETHTRTLREQAAAANLSHNAPTDRPNPKISTIPSASTFPLDYRQHTNFQQESHKWYPSIPSGASTQQSPAAGSGAGAGL